MQKENPPTHLIRSRNGDYLRGRLIKMDDKTLQIEIRLETKEVPRDRLALIIWLHSDELDPARINGASGVRRPRYKSSGGLQRRHPADFHGRQGCR